MTKSYRVHQFAELAGVTVKALRHYDRLALLSPQRNEAGYRLYQLADLERLQQIIALKSLGLSLKDIRTLLERDSLPLISTFRQQRAVLEDKRNLIERAIQALSDAEAVLASGTSSATVVLQQVIRAMGTALSRRHQWPDGMTRYTASLYELDVDTWQRVTDFIERAAAASPRP
jgi:DNA-binding transcriptional MerR regulator